MFILMLAVAFPSLLLAGLIAMDHVESRLDQPGAVETRPGPPGG